MGVIYKIQCGAKCYIGQTRRDAETRFREHQAHARRGEEGVLYDAMRVEGGSVEVLEECEDDALNRRERAWIRSMKSMVPNGYNVTPGGKQSKTQNRKWAKRARCFLT